MVFALFAARISTWQKLRNSHLSPKLQVLLQHLNDWPVDTSTNVTLQDLINKNNDSYCKTRQKIVQVICRKPMSFLLFAHVPIQLHAHPDQVASPKAEMKSGNFIWWRNYSWWFHGVFFISLPFWRHWQKWDFLSRHALLPR